MPIFETAINKLRSLYSGRKRSSRKRRSGWGSVNSMLQALEDRTLLAVLISEGGFGSWAYSISGTYSELSFDEEGNRVQGNVYEINMGDHGDYGSGGGYAISGAGGGAGVGVIPEGSTAAIVPGGASAIFYDASDYLFGRAFEVQASFYGLASFRVGASPDTSERYGDVVFLNKLVTTTRNGIVSVSDTRSLIKIGESFAISVQGSIPDGFEVNGLSAVEAQINQVAEASLESPRVGVDVITTLTEMGEGSFGPYLTGVNFSTPFTVELTGGSDSLELVTSVRWQLGTKSGQATKNGDSNQWTFEIDMGDDSFDPGTSELIIEAVYGGTGQVLGIGGGQVIHQDPSPLDFELQVDPGKSDDPIDVEEARFIQGISTSLQYVGEITGLPSYYESLTQIHLGSTAIGALTFYDDPSYGNRKVKFQANTSSLSAHLHDAKVLIGDDQVGDMESLLVVQSPVWLKSPNALTYNLQEGNYEVGQTRLKGIDQHFSFANTGTEWIDEQLRGYDSIVQLEGVVGLTIPLQWTGDSPSFNAYELISRVQILGEEIWKKTYRTDDLSIGGTLDAKTLEPISSLRLRLLNPGPPQHVVFLDKTFTYDLLQVPDVIEDLVKANLNLHFKVEGSFGLTGAGLEIGQDSSGNLVYVPGGTYLTFNATPSGSVSAELDAKLFVVKVIGGLTGGVSLPIDADLHFQGPLAGIPQIASGSFTVGLDFWYRVQAEGTLAGVLNFIDYDSGIKNFPHVDLFSFQYSASAPAPLPSPSSPWGALTTSSSSSNISPRAPEAALALTAAGEDDHGNSPETATEITLGSSTPGMIEEISDIDLFRVPLLAGQTYRFRVLHGSLVDPALTLLDSDGLTLLVFNDDRDAGTRDSEILYKPSTNSDVYLLVAGAFGEGTGSYDLEVLNGDDHGDDSLSATSVATGSITDGNLEMLGDADVFSLPVVAGRRYVVETVLGTLPDSLLTLLDMDGTSVLDVNDDGGLGYASRITFTASSTGLLFAKVNSYSEFERGTYQLFFQEVTDLVDDIGNDTASAKLVGINSTISGNLERLDDCDFFKFYVFAGRTYTFETDVRSLHDSTLSLYDSDGLTELAFNDDAGVGGTLGSRLVYTPTSSGIRYLKVGSYLHQSSGTYRLNLNSSSANTAPVLVPSGTGSLDPVSMNVPQNLNPGTLVSDIIARMSPLGGISDADSGALRGIAINGLAGTSTGAWEFTTDGGTTWQPIGATGNDNARLLAADTLTRIRYQPNTGFRGTARFAFVAWDQTLGTNGGVGVTKYRLGESPFSLAYDYARITVTNSAPVVDNSGSPFLDPVTLNSAAVNIPGTLVVDLISRMAPNGIVDSDVGAVRGIAINGLTNTTNGVWEFTVNNGTNWTPIGTTGNSNARLLAADLNTRIRYRPNAGFLGEAKIAFVAWDRTTGANGGIANVGTRGGTTSFSTVYEYASLKVVNSAPILTPSNSSYLDSIPMNVTNAANIGTLVSDLITRIGPNGISDPNPGALQGIAINGLVGTTNGTWQYTIDGGTSWSSIGTTGNSNARLLSANASTRVRFVPNTGFTGIAKLAFVAWDQTSGVNGGVAAVGTRGGLTAFSVAYDYAKLNVV